MRKYIAFLKRRNEINRQLKLSSREIELLNVAAKIHFANQPILMRNLIEQREIACRSTLSATIRILEGKDLVLTKYSDQDRRKIEVTLTKQALNYFKQLDKAIISKKSVST